MKPHRITLVAIFLSVWLSAIPQAQSACPIAPGDVNGDLTVNAVDVQCGILTVLWSLSGSVGPAPVCVGGTADHADIDCDGDIVVTDVLLVIGYVLTAPLPPGVDSNVNGCPDTCEAPCVLDPALCDDGSLCTVDSCAADSGCAHVPVDCNDANPCTTDSCDPTVGCVHTNVIDGTLCNGDDDGCTHNDHCASGTCIVGNPPPCTDGLVCTYDECVALGPSGYTCVSTVYPGACFSGEVTTIDAPNFVSFSGCGPYFGTTAPGGLMCTGSGCANVCGTDHHLDYAVTTVPGDSYQVVVKVADYLHNCKDKLKMSVRIGGVTIGTFTGTGTNAWAFPTFSFVATSTTTVLAITEDNDAGCKFNGTCSPTCVPLYNDLNMILDHIQVVRTTGGAPCDTCNDGNPCTVDSCNAQGECTNIPDDIVCDDGMACTLSHCDAVSGCINTPAFGFTVVYELNFPENANWDSPADIPYSVDLAAGITKPFDRVGYLWELDGPDGNAFVWAVMDTFTDDPTLLGVPVDWTWQIPVKNLTVQSNHPAIDNIVGHADGNIEFWSNCYQPGSDGIFDAHDDIANGAEDCAGSMQLHAGGKTIFAYNGWSAQGAEVDDLGFGPNTGGVNPDWTGMQSAGSYTNRKLRIYIGSHGSNGDVCVDDGVPCTVDVCSGVSGCSSVAADAPGSESQGQPGTPGTVLIDVATNPVGVPAGAPLSLAQKDAVLSCEPTETITDPDGSPITPIIEWTVNGQLVTSGPGLAATLGALGATSGDTVSCRLRTCDGSTKSFWSDAETPMQIMDAPLVVEPPTVLPVYVGEDFVCNAMANDPDGDWFSLAFVWEVTTAQEDGNVTTQLDTTSDTLSATYVADVFGRKSTVVCLTVVNTGTDTIIAASEPVEILNHPPTLSSVKLTGTKGGAYQVHPLVCTVGQAQDLDGDPVTVGILLYSGDLPWDEFSVLPGGTATSGPGPWLLGDEVSCTATPNDGFDAGAEIVDTATIVNHVPVCSTASVSPSGAPYPDGVNLTCACTSVVDYNGDTKGTSCKWTNWAGTDLGWTGCQRNTNDIPAGWAVFCNVAPTDGFGPGVSAPVLVTRAGSSPPTWDIPATGGVTLSPSVGITAVDINTVFTCAYPPTAMDPDGSGVTYTIDWSYKQGSVTYPLLTNDFNVASLTLKKLVTGALGASGVPKKNDSLFCRVHAKDGQVNSEIVKTSLPVVIADHPATFDVVQFPPAGGKGSHQGIIYPGETFSCESAIIDYDADTLLEVRIGTMNLPNNPLDFPALATTGPTSADYGQKSFIPMLNSPLVKQAIACNGIITFPPGAPAGTSTKMFSYELVMDAIPTVTATMVPENSTPCEFRYCVIDVYDDDAAVGYPIEGLAAEIRWEVDGTTVWNSTEPIDLIDPDGSIFVIPASGLSVDDGAQIQCFATIHKGPQIKSAEAASPLGLVTGVAPTVETVELPGPLLAGEMATCNAGVIINDCSTQTTFAYRWVVNGAVVPGATGQQFSTFGITPGAVVECEARVISVVGPASGPWTKSNPTILGVSQWTLVGPPDGGFAGASVAVLTDVNGDQRDEVVIGAPQATHDGQTTAGRVYIAFGADPGPPLQLQNLLLGEGGIVFGGETGGWPPYQSICKEPTPLVNYPCKPGIPGISSSGSNLSPQGDAAGTRVRAIGDITGDGFDDLLVSAPYAFALGKYLNGRTYIVSGKDLSLLANSPPQSISYAAWLRIDGEKGLNVDAYMAASGLNNRFHNGHLAGFGLAAGDFTGDGVPDIAIGAPNFDSFEGDNGRVYMLDGLALAQKAPTKSLEEPLDPTDLDELSVWLGTLFAQDPDPLEPPLVGRVFDGPKNFGESFTAQMGAVLNSMGDMNGDGKDELLTGPWGLYPNSFILTWDHSPQADGVAVSLQTPSAPTVVKNVPGYFSFSLKPGQVLSEIVTSGRLTTWARAAIGGDMNGDGLADLVAPAYENEGGKKQIEIAVIFGAPGLTKYDHNTADDGSGGFTIEGNTKEGKSDGFIDAVPAGDLDGDGLDEVAFIVRPIGTGAPKARLYVAWGKTDGTTVKLSDVENGIAGFVLNFPIDIWSTATGDVNGDGLGDLVIGIGGDFTNPPQNGFAEVHYGRDLRGLLTQRGDAGDNVLLGSPTIDRFVGGRGDDILIGLGGADALYGGPGNDRIEVSDAEFVRVDGATGTDTLALDAGVDLDLTKTGSRVRGFEAIELGGGQTLTLSGGFAGRQSQSTSTLAVTGSGTVDSAPAQLNSALWGNWYNEGASTWPEQDPTGVPVTVYRSGPTRLLVEQGIKTLLPPGFVNLVFEVGELQPNGTVVGNLDAVDADGYIMGLELVDGDPFGIFAFDPFTGSLVLVNATPLNFELRKFWTLTVKATDNDGLEREGEIVVRILDENEAPVFAPNADGSVVEGAPNGTVVAQVHATDPDDGDVVTYTMAPHEVFSLDPVSGLVKVINGGAIDFESVDTFPLSIIATDSYGLTAQMNIVVNVTDVANIAQTMVLWFVTEKRSLSGPQDAYGFNVPPTTHTIDFDNSFLPQMPGGFQTLSSEYAVSGSVSGQIETTFGGEFGSGEVNAVLPVSVNIMFPDELHLGEPFTLDSTWTLGELAQFWGETTHVNFFMNQSYTNIAMKLQQFGETLIDIGPWSFNSSAAGKPFTYKLPAKPFQSVRFKDAFPNGVSVPTDLLDLADLNDETAWVKPAFNPIPPVSVYDDFWQVQTVAEIGDAQELAEFVDENGAFQDDELMVTPEVTSSLYDGYILLNDIITDWLGLGVGVLKGNPTWATFEVPVAPFGYVNFLIELYRNWLTVKLKIRETFFLDIAKVKAIATFEDGTVVPFVVGNQIEITLPETADVNADGKVEVAFEFSIETLFTHWKVFRVSLLDTSRIGFLSSKSYKYNYSPTGAVIGKELIAEKEQGPLYESTWIYGYEDKPQEFEQWSLEGFNKPEAVGTVDLAQ